LIIQDHQGDVTIMLQNISDVTIEIPQCTAFGFIDNFKNDYFKEISQIERGSAQQKFSENLPLPKPLPWKSKKNFLPIPTSKSQKSNSRHTKNCWPSIMMCSVQIKMTGWANHLNTKSLPKMKTLPT
jgi:hypothetical protein